MYCPDMIQHSITGKRWAGIDTFHGWNLWIATSSLLYPGSPGWLLIFSLWRFAFPCPALVCFPFVLCCPCFRRGPLWCLVVLCGALWCFVVLSGILVFLPLMEDDSVHPLTVSCLNNFVGCTVGRVTGAWCPWGQRLLPNCSKYDSMTYGLTCMLGARVVIARASFVPSHLKYQIGEAAVMMMMMMILMMMMMMTTTTMICSNIVHVCSIYCLFLPWNLFTNSNSIYNIILRYVVKSQGNSNHPYTTCLTSHFNLR